MSSNCIINNNHGTTQLINDLKNSPKQYPPLNKAEEEELINKYRHDRDKLNELLYMHNIRLVFNMAKKYASKTNDFDSLISDCLYGLAEACRRFDIDKGIKFSTYATQWIFKYCLFQFNTKNKSVDQNSISIDQIVQLSNSKSSTENNGTTLENYINEYIDPSYTNVYSISDELSSIEQKNLCEDILKKINDDTSLSSTEKEIFNETIYSSNTMKDIAEKFKITVRDVSSIKHNILNKLKDILKKDYNIKSMDDILLNF